MKSSVYFPPEYFLKYSEHPVKIKPYSVKQGIVGDLYIKKIKKILKDLSVDVMLRGSSAYKISGKGDVEIGIYPGEGDWEKVIELLKKNFGNPETVEENYVRFNFDHEGVKEVELILLKGREAETDRALHEYLMSHPEMLREYEEIKKKYSYSKREYNFRKNEFLRKTESFIPKE